MSTTGSFGLHLGDVIEKADGSAYGSGINVAARLQALAEPGGIIASDAIRGAVKGRVLARFADLGAQRVKNIAEPVHAFRLQPADPTAIAHAVVAMDAPVAGFGGRPAIAVLAFANLSGDPEQEYFADGLAEDILTRLAMWRWLPVIARNSSFTFKGRAVDVKAVGRALGARYVLEGSVRKAGNRVRVTGQLIDATTGHHLWAERYDRVLEDLFAIQDELTDGIVGALEGAVERSETECAHLKPPASLDAWEACQRGWWHYYRYTREDLALAVPLFRRALELDPSASLPHSAMAYVRVLEALLLWADKPREAFAEAMTSGRAAIAADSLDASAYQALGYALAFTGKHDEALAVSRKCIELHPSVRWDITPSDLRTCYVASPNRASARSRRRYASAPTMASCMCGSERFRPATTWRAITRRQRKVQKSACNARRTIRWDGAASPMPSANSAA